VVTLNRWHRPSLLGGWPSGPPSRARAQYAGARNISEWI